MQALGAMVYFKNCLAQVLGACLSTKCIVYVVLLFCETFDPKVNGSKVGFVFIQRFDGSNGGILVS